VLVN
jgi:hypothetical protein